MFHTAHGRCLGIGLTLGALVLACGCTPPGARALLKGDRLLRDGRPDEAIVQLETAVELLPEEARAWNFLGLAYHQAGQPVRAREAYQRALALDRDLASARFNLGCLLLEQNEPQLAVQELTSFTGLQVNSASGWLKLGHAQLRSGQPAAAEQSFGRVLLIETNSAAALNGLGLSVRERARANEAWQYFDAATRADPDYAAGQLNLAIMAHQVMRNTNRACSAYERYLELKDVPHQKEVRAILASLRPPAEPVVSNPPPAEVARRPAETSSVPARVVAAETNKPVATPQVPIPQKPELVASNPPPREVEKPKEIARNPTADRPPDARRPASGLAETPRTNAPAPVQTSAPPALVTSTVTNVTAVPARTNPPPVQAKRTDIPPSTTPSVRPREEPVVARAPRPEEPPPRGAKLEVPAHLPSAEAGYPYADYRRARPGDRAEAIRLLNQGINEHRAYRLEQALELYRQAAEADPSLFEAHYNRGVAAFEAGELGQALRAYERALSVDPDSVPARFNFATTLEKSGYPADAVAQLENVVAAHPDETRAHMALGNLYANTFRDDRRARTHYSRVLQLEPQHPSATSLRFWLEAH